MSEQIGNMGDSITDELWKAATRFEKLYQSEHKELLEHIAQLQRDNEALRRRNDNLRKDFLEALAAAEAKCERLKAFTQAMDCECSNHKGYVKADCDVCEAKKILSEPPSVSLTNYIREQVEKEIREQTNEVVVLLEGAQKVIDSGHFPTGVKEALAKLKEIRGEK